MIILIEKKNKKEKGNMGYDKTGYHRVSLGQVSPSSRSSRRLIE